MKTRLFDYATRMLMAIGFVGGLLTLAALLSACEPEQQLVCICSVTTYDRDRDQTTVKTNVNYGGNVCPDYERTIQDRYVTTYRCRQELR